MKSRFDYGNFAEKYDMTKEIEIGTGKIKVNNIFDKIPDFMKQADFIFCDPPCSLQNINCFYTKADRKDYQESYNPFLKRFWEVIDEIRPKTLAVEIFKSNSAIMVSEGIKRYKEFHVYNSTYYHNKKNKCQVAIFSDDIKNTEYPLENIDEEDCIKYLCENAKYECIGDFCMGQGLVGFYANQAGRKFVGTELNPKRLAVLIERIKQNKLKVY